MIKIENWFIGSPNNIYCAPELCITMLQGVVYGHPCFMDGHLITSSQLVEVDLKNMTAKTKSGSVYTLGAPLDGYAEYMGYIVGQHGGSSSYNPFPANSKASEHWLVGFEKGDDHYQMHTIKL